MRLGIGNKISLLTIALVLGTALSIGFILSSGSSKALVEKETEAFQRELHLKAHDLEGNIENIRSDVLLLSRTPAIEGIVRAHENRGIDPLTKRSEQAWRDEFAQLLRERMVLAPDYFQIRLIGVEDNGREMVRVERRTGVIKRTADAQLQQKAERDYFQKSAALRPGQVYLSEINLNREHGKVEVPYIRTLRVATPVYSTTGSVFGIAIINVDMGRVLDRITGTMSVNHKLYVTNDVGDFLAHPEANKSYGFEFGKRYRIQDEIPAMQDIFAVGSQRNEVTLEAANATGNNMVYLYKSFYDPAQPGRFIGLVQSAPMVMVTAEARELQRHSLYLAMLLAGLATLLAYAFSTLLTRPLQQITDAAHAVSGGNRDVVLPTQRSDELGQLAQSFEKMIADLNDREQTVRDGKTKLKAVLDTVVDGIVTINERGKIDAVNPAIERMFGYSADELYGKNVSMLMPKSYAEQHDGYIRNYLHTGDRRLIGKLRELTGQDKNGGQFPILLAVSETMIHGERLFVGSIQDVSELHRSEERTRRLGKILETSSNEIVIFDYPSLRIQESNHAALSNLGYLQDEVAERRLVDLVPAREREKMEVALASLDSEDAPEEHLDSLFQRADGTLYPVEIRLFVSRGKNETVGVIIAQDITERQQQLEKLRAYAMRLESSNRELQDFAYVASHDLQEPLRKVQAFGDRLKVNEAERLSERGKDYVERMQNAASRMQILINDLLHLSRVTTKGKPFEAVDLAAVAQEVIEDLEERLREHHGSIELEPLPTVMADPLQMRQLLQNLLGNALKFHRPNEAPRVRVSSRLDDMTASSPAQYVLSVEDNGVGFENQYADRIFTPFERLHSRQEYEGTGMGLAICKKIVERHGGSITASATPGKGAVFTITLPVTTRYEHE